ncbi:universal stress protein [Natrialbaceae archaeon AArc-T1-2]|uniref:universal stress protein n=1 Tax=Natrialbaceae archaeon AArc-T1-2 TaxID=3053904 RepID=UPI00255AA8C6|nr:universal stress protein [Natrialbaceae archaeon AArc-T1-2]WIV67064.1 universal stress protein [Natrialbaceae archaeon AArc-T1-2]
MPTYDTILIPTDGSRPAERGVEHGLSIAADNDADVHFVHIIDKIRHGDTPALSNYELTLEDAEDEALADLEALAERAREHDLDTEVHCRRGMPHEEIVTVADAVDADLVVMGKHGEGEAELPHIGSVADRVLRTCGCPVFTV